MQQKISFERKGIDTLRLARILLPSLEKKTLSFVADFYEIDIEKSHRASYDGHAFFTISHVIPVNFVISLGITFFGQIRL